MAASTPHDPANPGHVPVMRRRMVELVGFGVTAESAPDHPIIVDGTLGAGGPTEAFLEAYPNAILNVHPALIPSFAGPGCYGLHVHEKALEYGVKLTGATVHFVSEECDGGPIVSQKAVEVLPDDTPEVLQRRVMEQCEWQLLPQAVSLFCQDRLNVEGRTVRILNAECRMQNAE